MRVITARPVLDSKAGLFLGRPSAQTNPPIGGWWSPCNRLLPGRTVVPASGSPIEQGGGAVDPENASLKLCYSVGFWLHAGRV